MQRLEHDGVRYISRCTVGKVSGTLTSYLRHKAKSRNISFELSEEYLWDLYCQQDGKCALSGVPIELTTKINKQRNLDRTILTASLDRINSSLPYVEGNVQWVHKVVNVMKQSLSDEEFIGWCRQIANHANPEPSLENGKVII